jgi:hypothetical protein
VVDLLVGETTAQERIVLNVLIMQGTVPGETLIQVHVALGTTIMPPLRISDRGPFHVIIRADCTMGHIIGPNVAKIQIPKIIKDLQRKAVVVELKVVDTIKDHTTTVTTIVGMDAGISTKISLHQIKTTFKTNQISQVNWSFIITQITILALPQECKVTIKMALGINNSSSRMLQMLISKTMALLIDIPVVR